MTPGWPARRVPRVVRGIVLLASMLGAAGSAATAADDFGIAQFGIDRWTESDGLDSNWVRDIVEGPDGFMWIATGNGLLRFDGRSFNPVAGSDPARSSLGPVAALARGSGGRLWIALEYGGVRLLPAGGSAQALPVPSLPDDLPATALLEDPTGILVGRHERRPVARRGRDGPAHRADHGGAQCGCPRAGGDAARRGLGAHDATMACGGSSAMRSRSCRTCRHAAARASRSDPAIRAIPPAWKVSGAGTRSRRAGCAFRPERAWAGCTPIAAAICGSASARASRAGARAR